tara:strand:+ start:194681 stop:194998 length:318 start_codon:yes stop_codon:yes gene_type:complete
MVEVMVAATVIRPRVTAAIIIPLPRMDPEASIIVAPHSGSASIVAAAAVTVAAPMADTAVATEAVIEVAMVDLVVDITVVIMEAIAVMVTAAITKFGFHSDLKVV